MSDKQITKNFRFSEFTYSAKADKYKIDNTPNEQEAANIVELATKILQPIRDKYGKSIRIGSGFRCAKVNKIVGGSTSSQHMTGSAADINAYDDNGILFRIILDMINNNEITVGQLIWEFGNSVKPAWIHISLPNAGKTNQILVAKKLSGKTYYFPYRE